MLNSSVNATVLIVSRLFRFFGNSLSLFELATFESLEHVQQVKPVAASRYFKSGDTSSIMTAPVAFDIHLTVAGDSKSTRFLTGPTSFHSISV